MSPRPPHSDGTLRASISRIVAVLSILALIASSAAASVHVHGHEFEGHESDVAAPATPAESDAPHAAAMCAMCSAASRDDVADLPNVTTAPANESRLSHAAADPDPVGTRWPASSARPRAPPTA